MSKFRFILFLKHDLYRFNELFNLKRTRWISVFSPRFIPVLILRISNLFRQLKLNPIAKFFSFLNFCFFGIEISNNTFIDHGIFFPHTSGTVIGADKIGKNCIIFQGVTLGSKYLDSLNTKSSRPIIYDNVTIGAGAKVLGGISISSGTTIRANSLVTANV